MTLPYERSRAVVRTEEFLRRLINPKLTPGISRDVRDEALILLRHYPSRSDIKFTANGWGSKLHEFMFECPFADPDEKLF